MPTVPLSEFRSPGDYRRESLATIPSYNSQPEMSKSGLAVPPPMKRNSSSGPPIRQSTLPLPMQQKKRISALGVAASQARYYKVLGDLYLLSGRMEDAIIR